MTDSDQASSSALPGVEGELIMTAPSAAHPIAPVAERVPRTIDGISDALRNCDRMEFYREVGQALAGPQLQQVVATWWGRAMLATDPARAELIRAVESRTLPTISMVEVLQRRRAAGGSLPDDE
jgi:hypothetical protein